jgi:serine/threonine protein kinase
MATGSDNRIGEIVENYRLTSVLGTGSTSIVYLAQRLDDEHAVAAVKVLTFHDAAASVDRAAFRTRFLREARAASKLRHDHILPVLSYGEVDDLTYMVMPVIASGTLATRLIAARSPLSFSEIATYARQLASALDYAHDQGIVHRDVKPSNILLDRRAQVYLTDFGIARLFDAGANAMTSEHIGLTHTGQVLGTPYYMAPEQIKGEPVGPATDIYALGVVVYQMVTGQVPYQGDTPLAVAMQHLQDDPCPPSLLRAGLPPLAETAILRAIAKQPADRFASASALADALERAVQEAGQESTSAHWQDSSNETRPASASLLPGFAASGSAAANVGSMGAGDRFQALVGTTLGSYRLDQLVSATDLGPIFHARSIADGTPYRLRVLAAQVDQPAESRSIFLGRVQQLAHSVAALQHPYILPLVDYGSARGMPYLVSPHVSSLSLAERLTQTGPMELLAAGRYLDRIAAALEYAHEHSILHRNLTADCIFVQGASELAVADFEVRRMVEQGSPPAAKSATYYDTEAAAPEQLLGKPIDTYTDVYALGVVLYSMITGRPIYSGATKDDIAQQHLHAAIPPLRRWRAGLPTALESILARALAKEPEQRFRHPAELSNAYRQIVGSASGSYTFGSITPTITESQAALVTPTAQVAEAPARADPRVPPASAPRTQGPQGSRQAAPPVETPVETPTRTTGGPSSSPSGSPSGVPPTLVSRALGEATIPRPHTQTAGRAPGRDVESPAEPPSSQGAEQPHPASTGGGRPRGDTPPAMAAIRQRVGVAVATLTSRGKRTGWIVGIVAGVVLAAILIRLLLAAGSSGGITGPYADATFSTHDTGDVGFRANDTLTINAVQLSDPPQGKHYVAWFENIRDPSSEPDHRIRLGSLTKEQLGNQVEWTVTFNGNSGTNLLAVGNTMLITAEDASVEAPLAPAPGNPVLQGTFPPGALVHLQHLLVKFTDPSPPQSAGLLVAMRHQVLILQGQATALKESAFRGDTFKTACYAQSVLDIIEGKPGAHYAPLSSACVNGATDQLGDGYGFIGQNGSGGYTYDPYTLAVEDHMNLAVQALGNATSLPELKHHAGHVHDAMEHVRTLLTAADQDAVRLLQNPGMSTAADVAGDLAAKCNAAVQLNQQEGAAPDAKQFGVLDAYTHSQFAGKLRLTPPK